MGSDHNERTEALWARADSLFARSGELTRASAKLRKKAEGVQGRARETRRRTTSKVAKARRQWRGTQAA